MHDVFVLFLSGETFSMDYSSFFVIYPSYMDSTKTIKQGRRISHDHAVETPTVNDIGEALQSLQLRHVLEPNKGYSRDPTTMWDNLGRVRVEPTGGQYTKLSLLVKLASIIITLPTRLKRIEIMAAVAQRKQEKRDEEKKQKQLALQQKSATSSSKKKSGGKASKSPTRNNKKKGKKKR